MAFRLNERALLQEALEAVPPDESECGVGPRGLSTCRRVLPSLLI